MNKVTETNLVIQHTHTGATIGSLTQPLPGVDSYLALTAESCTGQESTLTECDKTMVGDCRNDIYSWVTCRPGKL